MNTHLNKTGIDILKNDFEDVPDLSIEKPSLKKFIFVLTLIAINLSILFYLHFNLLLPIIKGKEINTKQLVYAKISFCFFLFTFFSLVIGFLLDANALRLSESGYRLSIIGLITTKETFYMRIVLSLLVSSLCLIYYEHLQIPSKQVEGDEEVVKSVFIIDNFTFIVLAVSVFLSVQLVRALLITVLRYKMHFAHYKNRIEVNNRQNDVLYKINRVTGRQMYCDVKEWATWVFNLLTNHKKRLTRSACRHFFDEKDTEEIFQMFDFDSNGEISVEEFLSVFFGVIREKYFLNEALSQKNTLLSKLNRVLYCFSIPMGVFFASAILGGSLYLKNYISAITGAILSLSFVFSSLAGEVFRSLIFIFLIRPFEAGDVLKIDDKIMTVQELGLLYTSYSIQSLTNYIQNINLMNKNIINYRLSDVEEKIYSFIFNFDRFSAELNNLETEIESYLKSDVKKYTGSYEITNFKYLKGNTISVDIVVHFKINFQYIRGLIRNEDEFVFALTGIFKRLNLTVGL